MGLTQSCEPKLTPEQQDIKYLGERCPFGDAELWYLYRVYESIFILQVNHSNHNDNQQQRQQSPKSVCIETTTSADTGIRSYDGRRSFLSDLAVECVDRSNNKNRNLQSDPQQLLLRQRVRQYRKALIEMVEQDILPPKFGNRMYRACFLQQHTDICIYPTNDENSNNDHNKNDASPEAIAEADALRAAWKASNRDPYTRKERLERFFDGLSNSTRRGAKAALKVLFETCYCHSNDQTNSNNFNNNNNNNKTVHALQFVEMGYRLALAVEFLRENGNGIDISTVDKTYLAPETTADHHTLRAFANSLVEIRQSRQRRFDPLAAGAAGSGADANMMVEFDDVLEWSEAVAPLFASILPTFFHYILFPDKVYRPSSTPFEFPRIGSSTSATTTTATAPVTITPMKSIFFQTPNSPTLFVFGCLAGALTGRYHRIYTSDDDGLSFNRLQNAVLGYAGPTLTIIQAATGQKNVQNIFGAFTASPWKESADFYGTSDCFLYQLAPQTAVYRPTGNERNFMYCNSTARSKGYDQRAHGIGFGGTIHQPRLFLEESNMEENSIAASRDLTFQQGTLLAARTSTDMDNGNDNNMSGGTSASGSFTLECLEVWGVGGSEVVEAALDARLKARQDRDDMIQKNRKVDKAQFLDDFKSGLIENKNFAHRQQVDGRVDLDNKDNKK